MAVIYYECTHSFSFNLALEVNGGTKKSFRRLCKGLLT